MLQIRFLFLFLCSFAFCQEYDDEPTGLKGNIKSIQHKVSVYFSEDPADWMIYEHEWNYNQFGNITKMKRTNLSFDETQSNEDVYTYEIGQNRLLKKSTLINTDTISQGLYSYNREGKSTKKIFYSQGEIWNNTYFTYDKKGRLIEELIDLIQKKDSLFDRYAYDDFDRKIRDEHISKSYHLVKTWQYDQNGNCLLEKSTVLKAPATIKYTMNQDNSVRERTEVKNDPNDSRNYTIVYTYDNDNRIELEIKTNGSDSVLHDIKYTYNSQGDIIFAAYLNPITQTREKLSYSYEYDHIGNWTKKYCKIEDYLESVEERTISYW
jgi:hypothetical protein